MDTETEGYIKALQAMIRDLEEKDNQRQIKFEELKRRVKKLEEKWKLKLK